MPKVILKLPSIFLILLGAIVMVGWWTKSSILVQLSPNHVPVVFNSALCFVISGFALFLCGQSRVWQHVQMALGAFLILFVTLILSQDLFNVDLGLDNFFSNEWLPLGYLNASRMAPSNAIALVFCGLIFLFLPFAYNKALAVAIEILIFAISLMGVLGLTGYLFQIEILYGWYSYTHMALRSSIGLIILGLGLWGEWRQNPYSSLWYEGREDNKIILASSGILLSIALVAGLASYINVAKQQSASIGRTFQEFLSRKSVLFQNEMDRIFKEMSAIRDNSVFQQAFRDAVRHGDSVHLQTLIQMFLAEGFSGVTVFDSHGHQLAIAGTFVKNQRLQAKLNASYSPYLFWNNGWYLHITSDIDPKNKEWGYLQMEWPLLELNKPIGTLQNLGASVETLVCKMVNSSNAMCLPSLLSKKDQIIPLTLDGHRTPVGYALSGQKGLATAFDYRDQRVLIAYTPVNSLGLAMMIKIDEREIYLSIIKNLHVILLIIIVSIILGILLLRLAVMPLVRKLIDAEKQLLRSNILLRHSEERYDLAVTGGQAGLWDWDVGSDYAFYAPYFRKMLGYNKDEWPDTFTVLKENTHPDDREKMLAAVNAHLKEHVPFKAEYRLKMKSSEYHWFQAIGQAIWNEQGVAVRMSGAIVDITERKKIDVLKNEFISVVSHELRTPLTSIRGALGLILGDVVGEFPEKVRKLLDIANNNSERLLLLINDILDIEKIEAGKMTYHLRPILLSELVADAIKANQMYAEKYGVKLHLIESRDNVKVNVDPDRLMQVMSNLISNAVKFSTFGEPVIITLGIRNDNVRVSVIDRGVGISPDFKQRIFQKFSQADSSSTRGKGGTGLGLSISRAIVERLGGTLDFVSELEQGSTFYFELPFIIEPTKADAASNQLPAITKFQADLLICEDNEEQAKWLRILLEAAGYNVEIANSAAQAKQCLSDCDYDALLLDLILPDQDGIALVRELRSKKETQNLPIIVLSMIADSTKASLSGDAISVVDWLEKPIDFSKLFNAIAQIRKPNLKTLPRILHVEDDMDTQFIVAEVLRPDAEVCSVDLLSLAKEKLAQEHFDLVILDLLLPDGNGVELLPLLAQKLIPVIVFSVTELDQAHGKYVREALVKSTTSNQEFISIIKQLLKDAPANVMKKESIQ